MEGKKKNNGSTISLIIFLILCLLGVSMLYFRATGTLLY